ncbi:Molybdate transporter 1 [Hibiscus syriacus]|uniref:Molybdate transporter 1 n=1 Tax=Hibiscus syriacus TaxID=106335 RepID=A0A6A3CCC8_HIBSY|nr:Molybdate transporter 1 [Hibiscus syriacus]
MDSENPLTFETQAETPPPATNNILHKVKRNLSFQSTRAELNGAMGDLGTYIPIVLALTLAKDLNLGTTLVFTGVYNIITGAIYGVPMPVQPMKAIAAAAISNSSDFDIPEIMAAGICTGAILLVLGATGLMQMVYRLIPLSVVRGIQLSQGLSFAMSAVKYIRKVQDFSKSKSMGNRQWLGLGGLVLDIICACFIIVVNGAGQERNQSDTNVDEERDIRRKRMRKIMATIPSAFIVFVLGVVLAFMRRPKVVNDIKFGPSVMEVVKIHVCKLSSYLLPGREFSATSVSITVGLMNLVGCWFGAMPCCHGAGGLAGQYKFGGRSGGCVAILGIELAMTCRDMNSKEESFVMLTCAAVSSAALGFVCGMLVYLLLKPRTLSLVIVLSFDSKSSVILAKESPSTARKITFAGFVTGFRESRLVVDVFIPRKRVVDGSHFEFIRMAIDHDRNVHGAIGRPLMHISRLVMLLMLDSVVSRKEILDLIRRNKPYRKNKHQHR